MELPRLKEWRESRGLMQKELAAEAEVSEFTVVRAEGGTSIRPSTARKIAEALGISVADLLERPPVPEEWSMRLLAPIAPAATALNDLFGPKVDANDFTIEEYERVGEAFYGLDAAAAVAVRGVNLHSEEGAAAAVREAFNRVGGYHSGGPMYELQYTLQRAYEELMRREEAGVPDLAELRRRVVRRVA